MTIAASASAQDLQVSVPNAILIDAGTNSVLFERGADAPVAPAATVKILTAELIFSELAAGRLHPADQFPVSEYAWRTGGAPSGGAAMFLPVKSKATVDDLLRGLLVASGNDAALVLAEGVAGSEEAFVARMNKRATELGLSGSRFGSPWGKDSADQKVTARDMARLAAHVIAAYPQYYSFFGEKEFTFNKIRQQNRNPLLVSSPGADGLAAGAVDASTYNLVGSAIQDGRRLIVAIFGAKTAKERAEEAQKLLQWGFRNFEERVLFKAGAPIGPATVYGGSQSKVSLTSRTDVKILLPRSGDLKLTGKIVYEGPVMAPVAPGAPVGRLEIRRGDALALTQPLQAAESVDQGSLSGRFFDALYELAAGAVHQKLAGKK
jgi:D-alanyl-D-alanine carboxypeptidase (penicillin-binding protein 5/6)